MRWHIGNIIEKIRSDRKMTQAELAAKAGMRPNTLGDLENNRKKTRIETLEAVAKALNVSVSELYLELEGKEKPLSSQAAIGICKAHAEEYKLLELIMHGTRPDRDYWIKGIQANLEAMSKAATEKLPPDGNHGPFLPTGSQLPGDRVGFTDYPTPVPAKTSKKRIIKRK